MQLRTEIEIVAPRERVWKHLVDFPSYAEWNPFLRDVKGDLSSGAKLHVVMTPGDGSERTFKATLLVVTPEKELRWQRRMWLRGLFDGEHFFLLSEIDAHRTRLVHGEDFTGRMVQYMGPTLTHIARGCVGMNQALKRRAEAG